MEKVDDYLALIRSEGLKLKYVIDSHTHADHISGAGAVRAAKLLQEKGCRKVWVLRGGMHHVRGTDDFARLPVTA